MNPHPIKQLTPAPAGVIATFRDGRSEPVLFFALIRRDGIFPATPGMILTRAGLANVEDLADFTGYTWSTLDAK